MTITDKVTIPPRSSKKITVKTKLLHLSCRKELCFSENAHHINALNEAEVLLYPGIYPRVDKVVSITASNYSDEPQTLELGLKVGHIQEVA